MTHPGYLDKPFYSAAEHFIMFGIFLSKGCSLETKKQLHCKGLSYGSTYRHFFVRFNHFLIKYLKNDFVRIR